jgi:rhamnosyltransferase
MKVDLIIRSLNEAAHLERWFRLLHAQTLQPQQVIVVDNESTDRTWEVVNNNGARLVTIPRDEFTYPRSLNAGMIYVKSEVAILTVAHAIPCGNTWIASALRHFANPKVAGVYANVKPLPGASWAEKMLYWPAYLGARIRGAHAVYTPGMGVFGATNAAIRTKLWKKHPFDERFERGGEDGAWATWALNWGYTIINDWRFSVRHSHGLGFRALLKQIKYWQSLGTPGKFDRAELQTFRRNLDD